MNAQTAIIAAEAGLTPLEWQAVAIGFRDADSGATASGRMGTLRWLLAMLDGRRGGLPLADKRLEALRRFGVAARATGGNVVDAVAKPLLDAGFARPQLAMVAACAVMVGGKLSRLA